MNSSNLSNAFPATIDIDLSELPEHHSELPERQWTDYAEITFLVLMLVIGAPLNLISIGRSFKSPAISRSNARKGNSGGRKTGLVTAASRINLLHSSRSGSGSLRGRNPPTLSQFKSLQVHLTVANLMIICVYGLSQICWLITIEWRGGDLGCRLVKFLHTFCFYATSNMVAMIAIDRLCVTIYVDRQSLRSRAVRCLRAAIAIAWLLACGSSLPQAFFWAAYAPFPDMPNWRQCVTVWMVHRNQASLDAEKYQPSFVDQFGFAEHDVSAGVANGSGIPKHPVRDDTFYEDLYGGLHLTMVFWFPALIVVCSYGVIVAKFHKKISQTNRETNRRRRRKRESEAAQFRQRIAALQKVSAVSEEVASLTQETTISNCTTTSTTKCENGQATGDQGSAKLLGLPFVIHSSQAAALRRRSRDVAIKTLTKAKRTTLRKTLWILLAYVVCWSPYNILELWRYFDTTFENSYLEILSNLIVLNAVLNPLIYSI